MHFPRAATAHSNWRRWLWISVAVLIADQATKAAVLAAIREGEGWPVTGWFSLVLTYNSGAAFSFLASGSGWQRWLFATIAVAAVIIITVLLKRGGSAAFCVGLALIQGGALGNLYDRVALGRVVDFLLFHYADWSYPAFNVADSAITVGAVLLIADSFRRRRHDASEPAKETR